MTQEIRILGVKINTLNKANVLQKIEELLQKPQSTQQLVTTNPEFVIEAQKNSAFRDVLNQSWLSVPDGYGIILAAAYLRKLEEATSSGYFKRIVTGMQIALWGILRKYDKFKPINELVTGTDLLDAVAALAHKLDKKLFLLGGWNETASVVADTLREKYSGLAVEASVFEVDDVVGKVNSTNSDILFVALNHPRAQMWIDKHKNDLNIALAIGIGGAFDYYAGNVGRAPQSWQSGFEWLYRAFRQPKRIKRIFNAFPRFVYLVYLDSKEKTGM